MQKVNWNKTKNGGVEPPLNQSTLSGGDGGRGRDYGHGCDDRDHGDDARGERPAPMPIGD